MVEDPEVEVSSLVAVKVTEQSADAPLGSTLMAQVFASVKDIYQGALHVDKEQDVGQVSGPASVKKSEKLLLKAAPAGSTQTSAVEAGVGA